MKKFFSVRFDDICPTMDWCQFERAKQLMDYYKIKPLIGVIPHNEDENQMLNPPREDFWEYIKLLQNEGWEVALHGFAHVYNQEKPKTLICGKKHSEFAGLSYEDQFNRIKKGNDILKKNGIITDIFFAPAHTYDKTTLKALFNNGFRFVSDGMSYHPYIQNGIKCIPCRSNGVPWRFFAKYNVAVCHPNEWSKAKPQGYEELYTYCESHKDDLVDYSYLKRAQSGNFILQKLDEKLFIGMMMLKSIIRK